MKAIAYAGLLFAILYCLLFGWVNRTANGRLIGMGGVAQEAPRRLVK